MATPPSYLGTVDNGPNCDQRYHTTGFAPVNTVPQKHPLFLYFVGTEFVAGDPGAAHDGLAPLAVTEAMAQRGFVALSAEYDNGAIAWLSDHQNQLRCLFADTAPQGLLTAACALEAVDCDLGIATWGHSQGGYLAVAAANLDTRVRGAWATGYGGDATSNLPRSRLRVVNGEADGSNGTAGVLNGILGFDTSECTATTDTCLRDADGSGWIIVRRAELDDPAGSSADHCWFDRRSCLDAAFRLEPAWVSPLSSAPFALTPNADWLADTARRP